MEQLEALQANTAFNSVFVKKELSTKSGHDLTPHEISATLQMSLDPAKLVLNIFQGYISQQWMKEESDIEECVARSYMLEQLAKMSPNIDPQVKKDAMKLAVEWSAKMASQHEDSIVSFLRFLATYGLISSFKKEEILNFFEVVVLHKQAPELFQLLGFTHQIFDDIIQYLISSHQVLKAIKVTSAFKLVHKFQPVQILKDYIRSFTKRARRRARRRARSTEERAAQLDQEITALTDVIKCITDRNLESEFPTWDLQRRILFLQKMKDNPAYLKTGPSTKTAFPVKGDKKRVSDTPVLNSQIVPHSTKSEGQKQPEMEPKIVHFTNNPPNIQGMNKRQRTIVGPATYPEFPQVQDRNLMPWQFDNRQVSGDKKPASDTPVLNSQIVPHPTKFEGQKQPEMEPKIVHFTNNPPNIQGMNKRQRTIVGPATYPEFPQVQDINLMPWQFDNRQVSSEGHGQFSDRFNVGAGNYFSGPQHPYPLNSWQRPM